MPGWGHQLASDRVLSEMRALGLEATEFGPDGFLPDAADDKATTLASYGLAAVGGFVPVVLHDSTSDPMPGVDRALDGFLAAGAGVLVLAAATGLQGYDERPVLDGQAWKTLFANLDRVAEHAGARGLLATLHPHVGTVVERRADVLRVLEGSRVPLCLDTGHLLIGGTDPAELARDAADRIAHAHLKDVDADWATRVQRGEATYTEAVRQGMYRPLGDGDVDIAAIVGSLEGWGYDGWYVLEQDTILSGEPQGEGPMADVRRSIAHLYGMTSRSTTREG